MPMIDADGRRLYVSVEGRDGGPTLMLSNPLGSDHADVGAADEGAHVGVPRHPLRPARPWQIERAAGRLFDGTLRPRRAGDPRRLEIANTHWCGLSMGGMVGQGLGATRRIGFGKLILANTACHYPDPTNWQQPHQGGEGRRYTAVADTVIGGWLTADFREREPQITANMKAMMLAMPSRATSPAARRCRGWMNREMPPKKKARPW